MPLPFAPASCMVQNMRERLPQMLARQSPPAVLTPHDILCLSSCLAGSATCRAVRCMTERNGRRREVWEALVAAVEQASQGRTPVLVAHSALLFDNQFVLHACQREGLAVPDHWLTADSLYMARRLQFRQPGQSRALQDLNELFELPPAKKAHSADDDVAVLSRVWPRLFTMLRNQEELPAPTDPWHSDAEILGAYMMMHAAPHDAKGEAQHSWADTWPNFGGHPCPPAFSLQSLTALTISEQCAGPVERSFGCHMCLYTQAELEASQTRIFHGVAEGLGHSAATKARAVSLQRLGRPAARTPATPLSDRQPGPLPDRRAAGATR